MRGGGELTVLVDGAAGEQVWFHWRGAGRVTEVVLALSSLFSSLSCLMEVLDQGLGRRSGVILGPGFGPVVLGAGLGRSLAGWTLALLCVLC